jgi:peptidoglycan/LPS O-acetylase OafA/YrhL
LDVKVLEWLRKNNIDRCPVFVKYRKQQGGKEMWKWIGGIIGSVIATVLAAWLIKTLIDRPPRTPKNPTSIVHPVGPPKLPTHIPRR